MWTGEVTGSAFEIDLAAQFGMVAAGEASNFASGRIEGVPYNITTTLTVEDSSGRVATLPAATHLIERQGDATPRQDDLVELVPQMIPWDRAGASVTGVVTVVATSNLRNPGGQVIATAEHVERGVVL